MKKTIIISAYGSSNWIGGVYYRKNILFSLMQNEIITRKYNFVVLASQDIVDIYKDIPGNYRVKIEKDKKTYYNRIWKLLLYIKNHVYVIFPSGSYGNYKITVGKKIYWIPDFQHHFYPQYFQQSEIEARIKKELFIEKSNSPLILSSQSAKDDFEKRYHKENVYILPFVSYIEPEIKAITPAKEKECLEKFGLTNIRYVSVNNQFWQHKNHIVVFQAIQLFQDSYTGEELSFVFTGELKDYRNPTYYAEIKSYAEAPDIKKQIKILGFIDRQEQIILMKNSEFIIQPSLFEGWGTVVEDAKVLNKRILLSNIPVHQEQKNNECWMFDPYNATELKELIIKAIQNPHVDDIEFGIREMYKYARLYSQGFQSMLEDLERK